MEPAPAVDASSASVLIDPLTPQERRVLRLLAEGASNQDIADQLVIAPATAKKHVANILSKLGAETGRKPLRTPGSIRCSRFEEPAG